MADFYAGRAARPRVVLVRYVHTTDDAPCVVDLVVLEADGGVRVRDFVWLPKRCWRDASGETALALSDLVGAELQSLRLVGRARLADQVLRAV